MAPRRTTVYTGLAVGGKPRGQTEHRALSQRHRWRLVHRHGAGRRQCRECRERGWHWGRKRGERRWNAGRRAAAGARGQREAGADGPRMIYGVLQYYY
jgi:hypothetical protein